MLQDKLQPKEAEDILQSVSEVKEGPRSKKSKGDQPQTHVHQLPKKVPSSSLKNKQTGTLRPKLELYIYRYICMHLLQLGLMFKRPF